MYDPLIGATLDGRYQIERLIGQGGMAAVYAARHGLIDKQVAIKVLPREHASDPAAVERFLVEARAASKVAHPNIVSISDFGVTSDGIPFFVMELLEGHTLARLLAETGPLAAGRAVAIATQLARGLGAAHARGVIHRDLKPENVFVLTPGDGAASASGRTEELVKIVDFGIARVSDSARRLTRAGMVLGTPEYIAPESATGQPAEPRTDQYALGCILYRMLTGEVPIRGDSAAETLRMHVLEAPVAPSRRRPDLEIPDGLDRVVMRLLAKQPAERYLDMAQVCDELARSLGHVSERQKDVLDGAGPTERTRRRLRLAGVAGVALLALVAVLLLRGRSGVEPRVQPAVPAGASAAPVSREAPEATVHIVLRSQPPGAEILEGSGPQPRLLGRTPLDLERDRGSPPLELRFRLQGHVEAVRAVATDGSREIDVVLPEQASTTPEPPRPATAPARRRPAARRLSDLRNPFE